MTTCAAGATVRNSQCVCGEGSYCPGGNLSCTGAACEPCPANMWCADNVASACESNAAAPENSTRCWCVDGFYRAHGDCVECPLHYVCVNETRRAVADFDAGLRTLQPGTARLDSAVCAPGMFRTARTDVCKPCPRDFFCPPEIDAFGVPFGLPNVVRCPENEFTYGTGAQTRSECLCKAGFKLTVSGDVTLCLPCGEGERCQAGYVVEEMCHLDDKVPSASHDACVCMPGFGLEYFECVQCRPGFVKQEAGDAACMPCAAGTYSVNITTCLACPQGATARSGSPACLCPAPYTWSDGACSLCPDDHYWEASACHACPLLSHSVASPHMLRGPAACVCPRAYMATPHNVSGALLCVQCPAGQYEQHGTCQVCPSGAWAPEGSTALAANSSALSVCVCNSTCHAQRVDGSCAGACPSPPPACTPCAAGHSKDFVSSVGNTDLCLPCAPGTYQAHTGAVQCEQCPEREWHELQQQSSVDACLCVPGFERTANASCSACAKGHFKDWLGNAGCLPCPVASYSAHEQATACVSCATATASHELFALALVREGLRSDAWGGRGNETAGNETAGNYTAGNDSAWNYSGSNYLTAYDLVLASNTTAGDGAQSVLQCVCEVGQQPARLAGSMSCQACLPGSFKETRSHALCMYCGTHSATHGHALLHHYGAAEYGASDVSHCVQCPAFSGQDETLIGPDGLRMSTVADCLCFRGHEATDVGCSNCSSFMMQPSFSNSLCAHCPAGHFFVARHVPCQLCDLAQADGERHVGLVANARNSTLDWGDNEADCVCRAGYERDVHGTCQGCSVGKFRNETNTRHCESCPADSFQHATAQLSCNVCPAHSSTLLLQGAVSVFECVCAQGFQPMSESEECLPCAEGTYAPARAANESSAPCRQCPENYYCPAGAVVPEQCPPGELSQGASHTLQQCKCAPGFQRNETGGRCIPCSLGFFAESSSNMPCTPCPDNKTTTFAGAWSETQCVCVPGHETRDNSSHAPCTACAAGFFQSAFSNRPCTSCGWGTITLPRTAATHAGACQCSAVEGLLLAPFV